MLKNEKFLLFLKLIAYFKTFYKEELLHGKSNGLRFLVKSLGPYAKNASI